MDVMGREGQTIVVLDASTHRIQLNQCMKIKKASL
jgi:hypothetical protein